MQLTEEQEQKVLQGVIEIIASKTWEKIEKTIEDLTCISVARAAGMLDLSTVQTRRVLDETIDFGAQQTRVSLTSLRSAIDKYRTKRSKRNGGKVS